MLTNPKGKRIANKTNKMSSTVYLTSQDIFEGFITSSKPKKIMNSLNEGIAQNQPPEIGDNCQLSIDSIVKINCLSKNKISNSYLEEALLKHYATALENAPKPPNMSKSQYFNYLAIQLLEEIGNDSPAQEMIDHVESFLKSYSRHKCKSS